MTLEELVTLSVSLAGACSASVAVVVTKFTSRERNRADTSKVLAEVNAILATEMKKCEQASQELRKDFDARTHERDHQIAELTAAVKQCHDDHAYTRELVKLRDTEMAELVKSVEAWRNERA